MLLRSAKREEEQPGTPGLPGGLHVLWIWFACGLGLLSGAAYAVAAADSSPSQPLTWIREAIQHHGLLVGLIAVFFSGLALDLTPCVYPMIPVTLAFFGGQTKRSSAHAGWLAALYVLGIALSYAALGMLTAQAGALFGFWLQKPAVLMLISLAIVGLSLSMFGVYDLQLPSFITRRLGRASHGPWGALAMGLVFGLIAAPCVGPFVGSLVLYVVEQGRPALGFLLFFVLGLGMGMPFLVLGIAADRIAHLPKAGAWLLWSRKVIGLVLLGLALWFLRSLLAAWVLRIAVMGLLLLGGAYLGWLEPTHARSRRFRWGRRIVGTVLIAAAVAVVWPQPPPVATANWVPFSDAVLDAARREGRPIIVDIYADWCLPCKELEHVTFRHADVITVLKTMTTLRLDASQDLPPEAEAFTNRYHIVGMPTILLFDRSGTERTELRLLGFEGPEEFLARLKKIQ